LSPEEQQRAKWSPQQFMEHLQALADALPPWFRTDYAKVSPDGPDHWMTLLSKLYEMWLKPVVIEPANLKNIPMPVLVMAGDHDYLSIEEAAEIYRALPKGQLIIVPASGHGTFRERSELVNLAIQEFLDPPDKGNPAH
jgi:pimeloyl-ACP methyl ester carboxylesterase